MEEFIQNILIGVRQWVNGKLEDITYVISSHINELTGRVSTLEQAGGQPNVIETVKVDGTALTVTDKAVDIDLATPLSGKVDKVAGKGLSTEDYTTAEKTKLSGIAEGAQANVIESISVNGNTATISGKTASVTIGEATTSASGVMSAADKTKLDGVASGAQVNVIETIKVNGTAQTVTGKAVDINIPAATVTGVKSGEKIIGLDGTELTSTLSIAIEKQSNIDYIVLKGKNNEEVSKVDASAFVTDGMLEAAGFYRYHAAVADPSTPAYWEKVSGDEISGHGSASEATTWEQIAVDGNEYIVLKWNTAASSKMTFINAAGLVDDYTAGTGISIANRTISLNAATASTIGGVYVEANSGLTLAADGKLSIDAPTVAQVLAILNAAETPAAGE